MAYNLAQQLNSMSHIYEQYQSSCDSLLFVHGLMSAFYQDLNSTTHTRKAQINTMTTHIGINLRKIVIGLHDDLANQMFIRMQMYSKIAKHVLSQTQSLDETIKQGQHCLANYEQNKKYITNKTQRIDQQIMRLQRISEELEKKDYFNNLSQKFKLDSINTRNYAVDNLQYNKHSIQIKLQYYQKEKLENLMFQQNLARQQKNMEQLLCQFKKIQESAGDFKLIYQLMEIRPKYSNPLKTQNLRSQNKVQSDNKNLIQQSSIRRQQFVLSSNRRLSSRSNRSDSIQTMSQQRNQQNSFR